MPFILLAILIFGFIHPGSKLLLDNGIPLSYFCFLYVSLRLTISVPMTIQQNQSLKLNKSQFFLLSLFGLVGCFLQFTEFKGISEGLDANSVTFLMFSFPVWLNLFSFIKTRSIPADKLTNTFLILVGLYLLTGAKLTSLSLSTIYPILAGFCIALWIILAKKLQNKNLTLVTLSTFYDTFSLIALAFLFNKNLVSDYDAFETWLSIKNLLILWGYALFFGLLPNLLFYKGSQFVSSQKSSSLMSLEPLFSTLYSILIWQFKPHLYFWAGALLIILSHLPLKKLNLNQFNLKKIKTIKTT